MSALMQWNEDGQIRPMTRDGSEPSGDCQPTSIRFLAGSGVTDSNGYWKLDVAAAVCDQVGLVRAVSFVATLTFTPDIDIAEPGHVMTACTFTGGFVALYARTFDCNCKPRGRTPFDYHVAIAYDFVKQ